MRVRHEYWKNIFDVENTAKDNRNYFRFKYSFWGKADLNDDISLYGKLTDEFKAYKYFPQSSGKKNLRLDTSEIVLDNLYLDVKNVFELPVDLRIGRQDFLFTHGEGFLLMDGTPYDGSRTFYFNAAKATWNINNDNSLDFIYINNPREDEFLPIINENDSAQRLNITDEEGYVLYLKSRVSDNLYVEPYYIFKHEEDDGGTRLQSETSKIHTPGVFVKYNIDPFVLRTQLAYQVGEYGHNDRQSLGGYFFLDRYFKEAKWSPKVSAGFVYLSGDDPSTSKNEGWDPLFSRWPWMSELYSLTYNGESGLDYWTNLEMYRVELSLKPTDKSKLTFWYNYLRAEEVPTATSFGTGSGKDRGHLPQVKLEYKINKDISTYILAEYFIPGDFHDDDSDEMLFLRTEITFKF
ncbi:MAG: alginate export family protein [Candidatus Zapsychrus exili]|nr:alginate export family protein [Candidatus Zapsychrus exili]